LEAEKADEAADGYSRVRTELTVKVKFGTAGYTTKFIQCQIVIQMRLDMTK
jgi:hypothetical protein